VKTSENHTIILEAMSLKFKM